MTCQIKKSLKVASLVLATLFTSQIRGQEAENLFKNQYSKLTFVVQPSYLKAGKSSNFDGSSYPGLTMQKDFSYQFGVYYNFLQWKNFNIKTGILAKEYIPKYDLNVTDEDIGLNYDFLATGYEAHNQFILAIPLKFDFFIPISSKFNAVVGGGINANFFTGADDEILYTATFDNLVDAKDIYIAKVKVNSKTTFSTELSIGFAYKAKFALFQLETFWNKNSFTTPQTGIYEIYNLDISPDTNGQFSLRDDFYGLSLQVTPKKGWTRGWFN